MSSATRSHILGGQVEGWGGMEGAKGGPSGARGNGGAPLEAGAFVHRGGMAILVAIVAFKFSARAPANMVLAIGERLPDWRAK